MTDVRTVFLDRDGTINVKAPEGQYVTRPEDVQLLPGAAAAIARLNRAGVRVVVVSNQRCVASGLATLDDVERVTDEISAQLASGGARVDAWYYCPHAADACDCRKPLPGLLLRAADELDGLELSSAVLIGDAESDVLAAHAAGSAAIRLAEPGTPTAAERTVSTLPAAVALALGG